jgi:CHASE2 domain-containing sensor protein
VSKSFWQKISQEFNIWKLGAIPGIVVIAFVIIARLTGTLQFIEWISLDKFLSLRPAEAIESRIVIIGINEKDIHHAGSYPIPDQEIAILINKIEQTNPRVIGLDLIRDIPVEPGHKQLVEIFNKSPNLIGIEKVLPETIAPPPELPSQQIGFSDVISDEDGKCRRSLLAINLDGQPKYSFSLLLANAYLTGEGFVGENGIKDPNAVKFGSIELPRFLSNSGGYVDTKVTGTQILLNWRSGKNRFRVLSLEDIKTGNFESNWLRDRIIIIGMRTPSVKDFLNTSAMNDSELNQQIYGIDFHAHAISQIISGVLDQRPLLKVWQDLWEYLWIIFWGFIPIIIGRLTQSVFQNLLTVGLASFCLMEIGYFVLYWWGWWIPVAPVLLILGINGVGLSAFAFYQRDKALKYQIEERQRTIESTFTVIHNGPLQTLANTLRQVRKEDYCQEELIDQLEYLNQEIREIGEYLKLEALTQKETLRLGSGLKLDLNRPINDLFYEVYSSTLERKLPCFQTLKVRSRSFEPIPSRYLSIEQKREVCQFLEEALCNIGKHAQGVKKVEAMGKEHQGWYTLIIKDNGVGIKSEKENKGTKQAKNLAKKLGGIFKRESLTPKGTVCELSWQIADSKNLLRKISNLLSYFLKKLFKSFQFLIKQR